MGNYTTSVLVTVEDSGCVYTATRNIGVLLTPGASFILNGSACLDSTMLLLFNGLGNGSADWHWDFGGADVTPGARPVDFFLKWNDPGDHDVSLWIDDQGCISDTFSTTVKVDAPLDSLVLNCLEEDYYSLLISWEPVDGATKYVASSTMGTGKISGNTFKLSNLPDDTAVDITVTAEGSTACGPVTAVIECRTLDYISPEAFFPDLFSPNGDGINDVFFIQSNVQVTHVNALRVFDRWGDMIFEDTNFLPNDPDHGWDGSRNDKLMNPGVYLYWAEYETVYGKEVTITGDLTLIR
jgi:gliding motility-associated-like protein